MTVPPIQALVLVFYAADKDLTSGVRKYASKWANVKLDSTDQTVLHV